MGDLLYEGDCLEVMKKLKSESVDCVITSPPYPGVNNMWGELYKAENFDRAHEFLNVVWDECLRLLRPGCKLIINIANTKRRPYLPNVARIY
jgi:DNA modification methylase